MTEHPGLDVPYYPHPRHSATQNPHHGSLNPPGMLVTLKPYPTLSKVATFLLGANMLQSGCAVGQHKPLLLPGSETHTVTRHNWRPEGHIHRKCATEPCFCQGQCRVIPEGYGAVYEPLLKAKALLGYLQSISAACCSREAIQRPLEPLLELVIPAAC